MTIYVQNIVDKYDNGYAICLWIRCDNLRYAANLIFLQLPVLGKIWCFTWNISVVNILCKSLSGNLFPMKRR